MIRCFAAFVCLLAVAGGASAADLAPLIETIKRIGPEGAGHRAAAQAVERLSVSKAEQLPEILASLDDAEPLAANWLHAAIDAIAGRELRETGKLPADALEAFALDATHSPRARRLAFDWLAKADPTAPDRLIPGMLDDPSVELRRDAVIRLIDEAKRIEAGGDAGEATELYARAFAASRDQDQIDELAKKLGELGRPVDLPKHYGFVVKWRLIGPFDNANEEAFDTVYQPEKRVDFDAQLKGKTGELAWVEHASTDSLGMVDLNAVLGGHKQSIGYAAAEFTSDDERPVEFRLGCITANKLWLNGELLGDNRAYHSGTSLDQYVARGTLQRGKNLILLKIGQNDQTEPWAQSWQFQLRVCDATGTAILSQ